MVICPFLTIAILSHKCKKPKACVTSTLVLFLQVPSKTYLKTLLRTFASRAEMGSSISKMSVFAYTALAREIRAF